MALVVLDRVKETTTTTGQGSLTLAGAVSGYEPFSLIGNGNTTYYAISSSDGQWEVGIGTYSTSGNTLSRDTILDSSDGAGNAIDLTTDSVVFITYPAGRSLFSNDVGTNHRLVRVTANQTVSESEYWSINGAGKLTVSGSTGPHVIDGGQFSLTDGATVSVSLIATGGGKIQGSLGDHFHIEGDGAEIIDANTGTALFTVNPAGAGVRVQNNGETKYLQLAHNNTNGVISVSSGDLQLVTTTNTVALSEITTATNTQILTNKSFNASSINSGIINVNRLGSGTPSSGTYLRGDNFWAAIPAAGVGGSTGATHNSIIRASGTGGSTVQSSSSTLNDSGVLSILGSAPEIRAYHSSGVHNIKIYDNGTYGVINSTRDIMALTSVTGDFYFDSTVGGANAFIIQKTLNRLYSTLPTLVLGSARISYHANESVGRFQTFFNGQVTNATFRNPAMYGIQGLNASFGSTNTAGTDIEIVGGLPTGSADGGSILFKTFAGGSSGTTLQTGITRLTITASGEFTFADAVNLAFNTTTGTKIGTSTSQKIGFWNATPVAQQVLATGAGATVDNVISLLQTLGLCRQS